MAKSTPKTKDQIITAIADSVELTKAQAKCALETLVGIAYEGAKQKEGFTLPGLGKIILVMRKARMGRNPKTGETMKFPAKKVVKFRVAKAAKDAILKK